MLYLVAVLRFAKQSLLLQTEAVLISARKKKMLLKCEYIIMNGKEERHKNLNEMKKKEEEET